MEFESNNTQEHDVDAIIANAYGQSNPSAARENSPSAAPQSSATPQEPQYKEYEFNARGQAVKIRENDPRFQQWLSQGHDYAQNVAQIRAEKDAWEKQRGEWEQNKQSWEKDWGSYREIDEFAKSNPQWWQTVEQSYQQGQQQHQSQLDPVKQYLDQRLGNVEQDIPLMKQFLQEMQTQKMEAAQKQEDAKLDDAMKSIQQKYADIDFAAKDDSGLSLEHRVLNHAVENGFPTFRAAFLDYYHDSLVQQAEARGKETLMQQMQKRQKLGLLDDPAPGRNPVAPPQQRKPSSWGDSQLSGNAILKEFNFG